MDREFVKPAQTGISLEPGDVARKTDIPLPELFELGVNSNSGQLSQRDKATVALLDKMIRGEKEQFVSFAMQGIGDGAKDLPPDLGRMKIPFGQGKIESEPVTEKERKAAQDNLAKQLKEKYKDTWDLLPKEHREAMLKLQNAVINGDLKQLKEWAKGLEPEVAEKMAKLVEKNLREAGAGVHIKSVDGRSLLYRDGAEEAVLIGADGKAKVVAIKANELRGTVNIVDNETPFISAKTLAGEVADSAVRGTKTPKPIILREKGQAPLTDEPLLNPKKGPRYPQQ